METLPREISNLFRRIQKGGIKMLIAIFVLLFIWFLVWLIFYAEIWG